MHAPVLVTPPADTPVSLPDAKAHLRVDHDDEDGLIRSLIGAATGHLDGWTGILGRCLEEQKWRQDFDAFGRSMRLPLWPIIAIDSIRYRLSDGTIATVAAEEYALRADALGAYVRFRNSFCAPGNLYQAAAVSVTFTAGYERIEGKSGVPEPIRMAMLLLIGHWYQNREAVNVGNITSELPLAVNSLIAPFRRVGL